MDLKAYKKWDGTKDFYELTNDSVVILYQNMFHENKDKYPWIWGIWGSRDVWDELFEKERKEYRELNIKRMKVGDILLQDAPEYDYVKLWVDDTFAKCASGYYKPYYEYHFSFEDEEEE